MAYECRQPFSCRSRVKPASYSISTSSSASRWRSTLYRYIYWSDELRLIRCSSATISSSYRSSTFLFVFGLNHSARKLSQRFEEIIEIVSEGLQNHRWRNEQKCASQVLLIVHDTHLDVGIHPIIVLQALGGYGTGLLLRAGVPLSTTFVRYHQGWEIFNG